MKYTQRQMTVLTDAPKKMMNFSSDAIIEVRYDLSAVGTGRQEAVCLYAYRLFLSQTGVQVERAVCCCITGIEPAIFGFGDRCLTN